MVTEQEAEEKSRKPQLTEYQTRLVDLIRQVEFIVFGPGAEAGYGKCLGEQLSLLRTLKSENPVEHDQLINGNTTYQRLITMFPNWVDRNNRQAHYESRDIGPVPAMMRSGGCAQQ